jgi:N-acetylmuramoyl-L-alanine amidase
MTVSEKKSVCIVLGTAHGYDVAGKQSPDGTLKEYKWSREMCNKVLKRLQDDGYRCVIDYTGENEIGLGNRCQIVNNYCNFFGKQNTLYFSIHCNAAGADNKWHSARGWESHIARNASEKSKKIANILWDEFEKTDIKLRRPTKTQNYWCNDFYVLKHTACPAVLVETLFQDSKDDVKYLLSKEGQKVICDCYVNAIEKYVNEIIIK